jgi:hypothetical protein
MAFAVFAGVFVSHCSDRAAATPREYFEGDHAANFERILGDAPPTDVTVVNSVVVGYAWRLGVVTTDDWEIEVIAPRVWLEHTIDQLHLVSLGDAPWLAKPMRDRQLNPIRTWYAPAAFEDYDAYYLGVTSIPYVHMLIEKHAQADGRFRAFISKH